MSGRIYAQQRRAPLPVRDADFAALSRPPASVLQPNIPTAVIAPTAYAAPTLGYDFGQMTIQRCGATPCDCSPEERIAHEQTEGHEQTEAKSVGSAGGHRHVLRHTEEGGAAPSGHPEDVDDVLGAGGQSLDDGTRTFMESRFGHDFSRVRIHTDTRAAHSARSLNALAYTVGRDIVFGAGHYAPQSTEGRRLIAHELTHVVQQAAGPVPGTPVSTKLAVSHPEDEAERAAEAMAQRVLRDDATSVADLSPAQRQIQRDAADDTPPASGGPSTTGTQGAPTNLGDPSQQPIDLKGGAPSTGTTTIQAPSLQFTTYHGKTLSEVESQMPDEVGSLTFDLSVATTGDPITSTNLTVTQAMTLPEWAERGQQCQPVKSSWDSFMSALRNHENGHTAIDNQRFAGTHQRYVGKAAGDTQTVSDTLTAEVQAEQDKYDTDTDHGRKQTPSTTLDTTVTCPTTSEAETSETAPANAVATAETSESDSGAVQTKLAVSVPGDPYEVEADRVADAVMGMADLTGSRGMASDHAVATGSPQVHAEARVASAVSGVIQRDDTPAPQTPDAQVQAWIDGTNISDAKSDILDNKINLGSVDPQRRMNLVNMFFNQTWVGPRDESAIKAILTTFGDGLPDIVNKGNIGIWNTSLDRAKGAVHDLPVVWHESRHFEDAMVNRADSYLESNTDYALNEKKRYGLGDDAAHPTAEQDEAVKGMQEAAKRVEPWVKRQTQLESMRVGKKIGSVSRVGTFYEPVQFKDAIEAPPPDRLDGEAPWQDVKKRHTEALDAIQAITANYPGLYAVVRDGKVADMKGATQQNARALMADSLNTLLTNIVMTKSRLHDPTSDLRLKLKPIYDQFKKSEDPWNKPFGTSIVDDVVKGKGDDFWTDLGLKGLEAALFIVVTLTTGGWGAVALTAIQEGVNVTQKWEEYNAAQQAQGTNLTPGTALVTNGQVNFALMDAMGATADAFIQLFLAAIPGEEAAAKAVDQEAATKALREAEGKEQAEVERGLASPESPGGASGIPPAGSEQYPAGLVEHGLDEASAQRSYQVSLNTDPTREAAIYQNPATGEYVCVQGERDFVDTGWVYDPENQRNGKIPQWHLVEHYHPGESAQMRLPSEADFESITHWQREAGKSEQVSSVVRYTDPQSKIQFVSDFGYNAGAPRPYYVQYRVNDGTSRLATFERPPWEPGSEYEQFLNSFTGDPAARVPGGNVPSGARSSASARSAGTP